MVLKRPPEVDLVALPTAPAPSLPTATTEEEIVTLSLPKKPRIQFNREEFKINPDGVLAGANDLRNRLAAFLPSLKAADEQLEKEKLAGRIADRRIEIDSDSDGSSSDSEEETDSEDDISEDEEDLESELETAPALPPNTVTEVLISSLLGPQQIPTEDGDDENISSKKSKKRSKNKQPYIEMNLGLGVLEELKPSDGGDDKDLNERRELIDRILELRRLQEAREESSDGEELDEIVISEEAKKKVVIEELE
ncbi:hypothetical protein TWF281_000627 [Arthrobotrys megalospora]